MLEIKTQNTQPKFGTHLLMVSLLLLAALLSFNYSVWRQEIRYYKVAERAEEDHFIVSVSGIPAIIIRSRAGYTRSRAEHAAEHLEQGFQNLRITLSAMQRPEVGFVIEDCAGNPCIYLMGIEIIQVTRGDVVGYKRRDPNHNERNIDQRLIAEYWRVLLQDIALLLNGQEPSTLSGDSKAGILSEIYRSAGEMETRVNEAAVSKVVSSLDGE
jgi:hypothetical protein